MREIECPDCYGEGWYNQRAYCFEPASSCCGGCSEDVGCELCEGKGFIYEEIEEEYEDEY